MSSHACCLVCAVSAGPNFPIICSLAPTSRINFNLSSNVIFFCLCSQTPDADAWSIFNRRLRTGHYRLLPWFLYLHTCVLLHIAISLKIILISLLKTKKKSERMISSTFFVVSICLFLVSATSADDIGKVDSYTALVPFPLVDASTDRRGQNQMLRHCFSVKLNFSSPLNSWPPGICRNLDSVGILSAHCEQKTIRCPSCSPGTKTLSRITPFLRKVIAAHE